MKCTQRLISDLSRWLPDAWTVCRGSTLARHLEISAMRRSERQSSISTEKRAQKQYLLDEGREKVED